MLSLLFWMVTDFDNTSSEVQHDQPPENWTKLSFLLHVFLPVTGLLLLFRQKQIFSKLLLQFDRNCVSVFCPSLSRREKLLKWAGSRLPETWSSPCRTLAGGVAELWSDGSLLCTLINSAIPGACPNPHRHWKKPPLHAQAIAYKYLGVIPIFTENELKGNLTVSLERNFLHYLNELQQAIVKLSERDDIPKSVSLHYVVRGMGLYSGEQHRKAVFYVYPNNNTTGHSSNIIVHIRGPYATYGKAIIPKFHNDLFATPEISVTSDLLTTKKLLNGKVLTPRNSFINGFSLPFMQYHRKHTGDNIVIHVTMEDDRAKVTYIPKNYGMYEIIMISNGELIRGCPFNVHILNNVSGIEDSFDGNEKVEDIPSLRKRKILSKTIDFIDKQMPVEDVLSSFNYKDNQVENHILIKNTKNKTEIQKDDTKESKSFEDVPTVLEKDASLPTHTKVIEEENEKHLCLIESENDDDDVFDLVIENCVETEKEGSVLEKQNSESTNEKPKVESSNVKREDNLVTGNKLNESNQARGIIHEVNCYSDNRNTHKVVGNDISVGLQLKSTSDSTGDDKKTTDVLDQSKQTDIIACKTNLNKIAEVNFIKAEVRKIKIPEKFCEIQNITGSTGMDIKFFKNVINTTNKKDSSNKIPSNLSDHEVKNEVRYLQDKNGFPINLPHDSKQYDSNNNNNNNKFSNLNHNENVMYSRNSYMDTTKIKAVPKRFLQNLQNNQNIESPTNYATSTSPICQEHIVPEVEKEYTKLSVAERRKIFSKKVQDRISTSTNSSFSESENAEGSPTRPHFRQFEGLSVLNYLGSLKKSEYCKNHSYPLSNAMSLPNISSSESEVFRNTVKARANFWEKISSSSSSLSINSESSSKRKPNKLTETERCKLIWKKPVDVTASNNNVNTIEDNRSIEKNTDIRKSADDILSITNFIPHDSSKKYKSMDHSLDKCTMMSIEERKKMLLKQNYEKELPRKPSIERLRSNGTTEKHKKFVNETTRIKNADENTEDIVFSPILDRIRKYDSVTNLSKDKSEETLVKASSNSTTTASKDKSSPTTTFLSSNNHEDAYKSSQTEVLTVKSHFKRAIKYFKNLEQKSLNKSKINSSQNNYRRYSLDLPQTKARNHTRGGSLNLPNIAQRFSLNNLYEDVFGDRRGSFKGAANRSALVEALATFSRKENRGFRGDEDTIMYEMFQRQKKSKRRKSVKSIFDVYY